VSSWRSRLVFLIAAGLVGLHIVDDSSRRGHERGGPSPKALGWSSTRDFEAAIEFVRSQPDVDPARLGGIGFSVGGEMLLQEAAGNDGLRAVVSEGADIRSYREV
jgi:uncharacterized protein